MDIRCPNSIAFRLEGNLLEVKCRSKKCGAGSGVVVLHYFDPNSNYRLVSTKRFRDPASL